MAWPVESSRTVYDNAWIRVREDHVVRPDRARGIYGVVEVKRPAVFVVALTDADEVWLLSVDRHTTGPSVELPAGGCEEGDAPLDAARRELAEEVGLAAGDWTELGGIDALNGMCRAPGTVFLARSLSPAPGREAAARTAGEQRREGISQVRPVPLAEVLALVARGGVRDAESLAALLLALAHLGRVR